MATLGFFSIYNCDLKKQLILNEHILIFWHLRNDF